MEPGEAAALTAIILLTKFVGIMVGLAFGVSQPVTLEECQDSTKRGLEITEYDPTIIDQKLAACELLYKE